MSESKHILRYAAALLATTMLIGGCNSPPTLHAPPASTVSHNNHSGKGPPVDNRSTPLAYINGQTITAEMMREPLIEASGGEVLSSLVLERMLQRRMNQANLKLTPRDIKAERARLVSTLGAKNADQAALLLREVRRSRGLGKQRFKGLLRRNAMMGKLVRNQVRVSEADLKRAYKLNYGKAYVARVIVVQTLREANQLHDQLAAGKADFADLAVKYSTDPSSVQGGLLPPISAVDPGMPKLIRDTLVHLDKQHNKLSEVVAMDHGYALVKLERVQPPQHVKFADVKKKLTRQVRRSAEHERMQQLARELLAAAKVTVVNPSLKKQWQTHKKAMLEP